MYLAAYPQADAKWKALAAVAYKLVQPGYRALLMRQPERDQPRGTSPAHRTTMDRAVLIDHLIKAERHIAKGDRILAQQRALIHELERDGHDSSAARALLHSMEELQALHFADRDRVRGEIEDADRASRQ